MVINFGSDNRFHKSHSIDRFLHSGWSQHSPSLFVGSLVPLHLGLEPVLQKGNSSLSILILRQTWDGFPSLLHRHYHGTVSDRPDGPMASYYRKSSSSDT